MNTQTNLSVANIIAQQIGNRAFLMMGTTYKLGSPDSLSFDIKGCREFTKVRITLEPSDTYKVQFFKCRRFDVIRERTVDGVYNDGLHQVIEANTGLRLSL